MAPSISKNSLQELGFVEGNGDCNKSSSTITLEGPNFLANGYPILTQVPNNITATQTKSKTGVFVGFDTNNPKSRHVAPLGKLTGIKFMSIFRFKVWWTTQWVGNCGKEVETETQMMILEKNQDLNRPYVLLLPLLEPPFRASLQAGEHDFIDVCVESGSEKVTGSAFSSCIYIHVDMHDPFRLVREAIKIINSHLTTFNLLEDKSVPEIVNKFGWCTWDAFYLTVHPQGVREGVKNLVDGGTPPGFLIIDDGWQSISHDDDKIESEFMNRTAAGEQMPCRLVRFEENFKFGEYMSIAGRKGMGGFIGDLKSEFKTLEFVYVWHALCGYWGGVRSGVEGLEARVVEPKLSKGLEMTMEDLAVDKIVENGVGLVAPKLVVEMYEGMHSYLRSVGIDGVKVDVIHLLEMLCEEYGGRVELAKAYYEALTASIKKHFNGNGVIASMEHCNDFMFLGTKSISLGRVGDDFWCADPAGDPKGAYWLQGCHMVHCAYNSLWMGNFIHPDWDMFQSTHPCAEFHAASRAMSGGPIYVSDSVGEHDFQLLKSLVLPDGSILRCEHYALPTRDSLFEDPLHDGKTILKIWNLNKYTGVLGAFNCQGGGWYPEFRKNASASLYSHTITCSVNINDIEWNHGKTPVSISGADSFAVYVFKLKKLELLQPSDILELSLDPFKFELFTISPVIVLPKRLIQFAPIGLVNMLNSGGAIQSFDLVDDESLIKVGVKGCGEMKAFASEKPIRCKIDGVGVDLDYDDDCRMVSIQVPWPGSAKLQVVEYFF